MVRMLLNVIPYLSCQKANAIQTFAENAEEFMWQWSWKTLFEWDSTWRAIQNDQLAEFTVVSIESDCAWRHEFVGLRGLEQNRGHNASYWKYKDRKFCVSMQNLLCMSDAKSLYEEILFWSILSSTRLWGYYWSNERNVVRLRFCK